jgi:MFS superfamily sulfate permease-like transporter
MNIINDFTDLFASFARANPLITLIALIILAFLIYRKPMFFLSIFFLGLLLAAVVYIVLEASSPGVSQKERLIRKGIPAENIFRPSGIVF